MNALGGRGQKLAASLISLSAPPGFVRRSQQLHQQSRLAVVNTRVKSSLRGSGSTQVKSHRSWRRPALGITLSGRCTSLGPD